MTDISDQALPARLCLIGDEKKQNLTALIEDAGGMQYHRHNRPVLAAKGVPASPIGTPSKYTWSPWRIPWTESLNSTLIVDVVFKGPHAASRMPAAISISIAPKIRLPFVLPIKVTF